MRSGIKSKVEQNMRAQRKLQIGAVFALDAIFMMSAAMLFSIASCPADKSVESGENAANLENFFGNISQDSPPISNDTPILNDFPPVESSSNSEADSLSSSYGSSYGSYSPDNDDSASEVSGSSSGSNSQNYPDSFGSSSLEADSQFVPSSGYPTSTPVTKSTTPSPYYWGFHPGWIEVGRRDPFYTTDTSKTPEDHWNAKSFRCGVQSIKPTTRVVGGSIAVKHSWPWAVNIKSFSYGRWKWICGGTLVSPRHAVSAMHCFISKAELKIAVAKHDNDHDSGFEVDIIKVRKHPYAKQEPIYLYYDMVLLTLKEELQFGTTVQPACLPPSNKVIDEGTKCWAYGWGDTHGTGGDGYLKQVRLVIGSPSQCENAWGLGVAKEWNLCAVGESFGQDTCQGDRRRTDMAKSGAKKAAKKAKGPKAPDPPADQATVVYEIPEILCSRAENVVTEVKERKQKDIVVPAMFAADMVLIIVAIALFSLASCPKVSDALDEGGEGPELDAIFGDSQSSQGNLEGSAPLNQFESAPSGDSSGDSLSSSYGSSYGNYAPGSSGGSSGVSGSSSGSNSGSYSNSFGSSSLDGSNSQYAPAPTTTTTTKAAFNNRDKNPAWLSPEKLKPLYSADTTKIPEDTWTNKTFRCGVQSIKPSTRIIGGTVAVRHSWPWIVNLLQRSSKGQYYPICGATLVSPRHAISALHCFDRDTSYKVLVAKHHYSFHAGYEVDVVKIRKHPYGKIENYLYYDMVLLTLKTEVQFDTKAQPACLPEQNRVIEKGKMCWAYGWGQTEGTPGVGYLKQVELETGSPEECIVVWGKAAAKEWALCAGKNAAHDTCPGDSGGPYTCKENGRWILYGATSYGRACGDGWLGVYAAISFSMNWFCCFLDELPECRGIACDPLNFRYPTPYY